MRQYIYIAGPYTAATEDGIIDNCHKAIAAGVEVQRRGHVAVIPHLLRMVDEWFDETRQPRPGYQFFMDWDDALLRRCDALLYLAPSKGADIELGVARDIGLTIYGSLEDIPPTSA